MVGEVYLVMVSIDMLIYCPDICRVDLSWICRVLFGCGF